REEIQASKEETLSILRGEIRVSETRMRGEIQASKEETLSVLREESDRNANFILEEIDRTRDILEEKIGVVQKEVDDLKQYYRIQRLQDDTSEILLHRTDDLERRVEKLEVRMA
ncbi:MAG: hypothetical protein LUE86_04135, partial [Clostridiales bacterium]|nr:hypothetical protein [Clostridiales bacterium]